MKDDRLAEMRIFQSVVDAGGFRPAARALGIGQSQVSRAVEKIEARLGVQLLQRTTRTIRATPAGERYYDLCRAVISEVDIGESEIARNTKDLAGTIRVTMPTSFGMDQVVNVLSDFVDENDGIHIDIHLSDERSNIIRDGFDLAVRMGFLEDSNLKCRRLCDLRRLIVASPQYIERYGMPQEPSELHTHNCLLWAEPHTRMNVWPFQCGTEIQHVEVSGRYSSYSSISAAELCFAGKGVGRVAEHLAVPAIRNGTLVEMLSPYRYFDGAGIYLVYAADRFVHPRLQRLIDHLVATFKVPPWGPSV